MNCEEKYKEALKSIISKDDLLLYKDLGNGLYKLHDNIITNEKGKSEFLEAVKNKINERR